MLYQIAFLFDRTQSPLSRLSAALHEGGHHRLSHAAELAIALLETAAVRLAWLGRPATQR